MSVAEQGRAFFKLIVLLLMVAAAVVVIWRYFSTNEDSFTPNFDIGEGGNVSIPKEMQINYIPAEYETSVDEEEIMKIMSNPSMYRRDFNRMVKTVNLDLLKHVAKRMNLPDSLSRQIEKEYQRHHNYLKDLYYHDVMQLKDPGASDYEKWYESDASNSVDVLEEVASKYTCFLVNHVITSLVKNNKGTLYVKGQKVYSPCSVAMEEGLKPMVKRLEQSALIQDFKNSEGILQERMERVIAELATVEVRDKKGLSKEVATKVWGYKVSSTDIEITAISIMKVGFKIDEFFNVKTDNKNKIVRVTLPEPKILSHEVYPKVDKLDVGWMRELSNEDFNNNFNILRREFRKDAMESNVFNRSKKEAEELMETILLPMVQSIDGRYKVKVDYRKNNISNQDPDLN